jgi:DNA repair protein RecN (Recombination protein N)
MLTQLTIKNYALIKQLEMTPSGQLNVITGETGAGKSIMLGAIGLLMGNRADTKVLWNEHEKCVTEGTFNIASYKLKSFFKAEDLDYADTTILRREISPGGKSRAFINDTPVTLDVMKKLGGMLMDIHSQHETLLLGQQKFQLALIDAYAENDELRQSYLVAWNNYQDSKKALETLERDAETMRQEADYIQFQLDELLKANLESGEQQKLEQDLKIIEHAEDIKTRFNAVLGLLNNSEYASRNMLSEARAHIQQITNFSPRYESLFSRLNSVIIELEDIVSEIEQEEVQVDFDPDQAEFARERINLIYRLLKKHHVNSIDEILSIQETLQQKAAVTSNLDEALQQARNAFALSQKELQEAAKKLTNSRKKIFTKLCESIVKLLRELGIPDGTLQIDHHETTPTVSGADDIELLFSANKGVAAKPLAAVASGGEFSRLMFCVKYVMAEKTNMPTLILDEIDNGVSGEIAIQLGSLMKRMATRHQVISISHLPQIAAKADVHYFVYKDNRSDKTISNIKRLDEAERVEEIAKMIGGDKPSRVAFENAKELLIA